MATGTLKKAVAIEVEAITEGAVRDIEKLANSTKKARDETTKFADATGRADAASRKSSLSISAAKSAMDRFGEPLQRVQALMGAGGLIAAATGAAVAVDKLSQRSIALTDVHANLRISLNQAKDASGGLVTNYDLATSAATALRFGVVKTSTDFARHVEIATKLARTTGGDATKAVEDFTTALARQSPQILDNLGLQVDLERANADYAKSIGKTASALTDAEKKQAFINAAYADAERKVNGLTVATDGWAVSLQRSKVAIADFTDDLLQLPGNIDALTREIDHWLVALEDQSAAMKAAVRTARDLGGYYGTGLRVALAGVTLGGSEFYRVIADVNDEMSSGMTATDLWAKALKQLGEVMRPTVLSMEQLVELQKTQGLVMSANARLIDALNYEQTEQYFANLEEEVRQEEAAKRKAASSQASKKHEILNVSRGVDPFLADDVDRDLADQRSQMDLGSASRSSTGAIDPFSKANELQAAEEKLAHDAETLAASIELSREDRHVREMARIEEEQAAREAAAKRQEAVGSMIGGVASQIAAAYLASGGASAKAFKKMVAGAAEAEAIRMTVLAVSEGVQALVALASLNFPGAAAHGIAAGAAAAGAAVIGGIAASLGGFAGGGGAASTKQVKGFQGSDFGAGPEPAANEAPKVTNSQKDTTAVSNEGQFRVSSSAQSGSPSGSHGGGNVYNFAPGSVMTLGAIDKQTATKLAQGLDAATKKNGRLTG